MTSTRVRKAVFPVAGLGTRFLPATKASPKEMLPVVDKPLIQYAVEEAYEAGIREGQVILKVGDFETSRAKHARYLMLQYPAEAKIPLTMEGGNVIELVPRRKPKKEK